MDQRYYASAYGRFVTPDPMAGSAKPKSPGSWNRYTYVGGDPIGRSDPTGQCYFDTTSGNYYDDDVAQQLIYSGQLNPSLLTYLGDPTQQSSCTGMSGDSSGVSGGGGGLQVFANDLGSCTDAASCMAFAQGTGDNSFDGTAGSSGQSPSCESTILGALNSTFGDNFNSSNVANSFQFSTGAPPGQGTLNLNISVPPSSQPSGVSAGRFPINWWTYVTGIGPTLHVPDGPGGADSPLTLKFSPSQFTAHVDSSFPLQPDRIVGPSASRYDPSRRLQGLPIVKLRKFRRGHCSLGAFMRAVALFVLVSCGDTLRAQVVKVKLVDGKSGLPVAHSCVNVWVGDRQKAAMAIPTDSSGLASLRLTDRSDEVDTHSRWKDCGNFGVIDPVVLYADSIRINAGYVLCQSRPPAESWLAMTDFSTKQLIRDGIVTPNTCGKAATSPEPGELVIFVRPLSFWEKLKQ